MKKSALSIVGLVILFLWNACSSIQLSVDQNYKCEISSLKAANLEERFYFGLLGSKTDEAFLIYGLLEEREEGRYFPVELNHTTTTDFTTQDKKQELELDIPFQLSANKKQYLYFLILEYDFGLNAYESLTSVQQYIQSIGKLPQQITDIEEPITDNNDLLGWQLIPINSEMKSPQKAKIKGEWYGKYKYVLLYTISD